MEDFNKGYGMVSDNRRVISDSCSPLSVFGMVWAAALSLHLCIHSLRDKP
jgi:hypothetical protein